MAIPPIGSSLKATLESAAQWVFDQFKRPFTVYVSAQIATISTNPNYSMFGQNDQNSLTVPVTPQPITLTGCILYANNQPWQYIEPVSRAHYEQDKIRNAMGVVRVKVDATGYAVLQNCKAMVIDGFNFTLQSNARPHSVFGTPTRFTFTLLKTD